MNLRISRPTRERTEISRNNQVIPKNHKHLPTCFQIAHMSPFTEKDAICQPRTRLGESLSSQRSATTRPHLDLRPRHKVTMRISKASVDDAFSPHLDLNWHLKFNCHGGLAGFRQSHFCRSHHVLFHPLSSPCIESRRVSLLRS